MKTGLPLLVLLVICAINYGDTARILAIVPTASYSHQLFFQRLWRELALQGHDMVVMTTNPTRENLTNFKEVDLSSTYDKIMKQGIRDVIALNSKKLAMYARFAEIFMETSDYQLGLDEVQKYIKDPNEHFDLVMIEYLVVPYFGFKHRFNCPFIGVMSLDALNTAHDTMGNPTHSVLYPNSLLATQEEMSFMDRLATFALNLLIQLKRPSTLNKFTEVTRRHFGEDYPHAMDLADSVDMLFINNNPMYTNVRPLSPSTISLAGGMHMQNPKPLPKTLQAYLDNCTQGFIYFSMGSNVRTSDLSNQTLSNILKTFSKLPYDILWKFELEDMPGKPNNVRIIKWAPQQDVLRHKNIKLFITQAGMQSLEEALYTNVPLIAIPFLGDQDANAGKISYKKLGITLDHKTITSDQLTKAIHEVINNPIYKENMKILSNQILDQPVSPLEKAVWWTNYVLRHKGGKHLRGPRIPLYQYYYLDVFGFLGLIASAIVAILFYSGKFIINSIASICKSHNKKQKAS